MRFMSHFGTESHRMPLEQGGRRVQRIRYGFSRLLCSSWAFTLAISSVFDPYSSSRQGEWRVNDAAVLAGDVFATLLLVVSIVSLLDCVINDFLPERFVLYTRRARSHLYPCMAILLCLMAGTLASRVGMQPAVLELMVPSCLLFVLTYLQIFAAREIQT